MYITLRKIGFNISLFSFIPMFHSLGFHVLVKVLVISRGRFGVLKYNTFCLLTHILQQYFHKKRINADIFLDSNAYTLKTGSFSVYFYFQKVVFLWPPSHPWHHKWTKIMFQITEFNLSKRSTEGCSKFKGPETRQVQERLVSTLEHMQVPKWDRTRCPEE